MQNAQHTTEQTIKQAIKLLLDVIVKEYNPQKVILFGSAAYGATHKESDVDLCIIKAFDGSALEEKKKLLHYLWEGGFDFSVEPDFHVYTPQKFDRELKRHAPFVREIVKGKVLHERI